MQAHDAHTRENILGRALALFAAGGYDGTSVDSIARAAQVNKATIYYYFSSKKEILDCLIEGFIGELVRETLAIMRREDTIDIYERAIELRQGEIGIRSAEGVGVLTDFAKEWVGRFFEIMENHRDILRVMLAESLKDGENQRLLLRISDLIAGVSEEYKETYERLNIDGLRGWQLVMKFFGGILPLMYYSVAADAWEAHYGMPRAELREGLMRLFMLQISGFYYGTREDQTDGRDHPP